MNHWNSSPIGQTNEVARPITPDFEGANNDEERKPPASTYKYLLGDELQKIRRSNHSSHHRARREIMDDEEHDDMIKGILYPGLEDSEHDFDFYEEDYEMAQAAVSVNNTDDSVAVDRMERRNLQSNTLADSMGGVVGGGYNYGYDDYQFGEHRPMSRQNAYMDSYFASMGMPYSDLSDQKL